ncbi:hypothetical protein AB4343_16910 [Vibrio breoganii]|uniref:Uncharacterized protein n=1 Tax=Vibrio breoganii TaxID=553239 RepID=A0ABX1U2L1_9VIBR|nr:hypothetical protein [Vibrio breoganii]NMO74784.1 hypothetical protein [Vibrio breoganii]NMR68713.1 hypothetical protein [Vibrio breoganii]PMG01746.1 hypothetical protein BCV02_13325 [Vibrio breoganii]PMG01870.1 hypothetical protein BCV00_17890 [Vibrio breoganii]PMG03342.1 hypothetical protein BCV08_06945 [Vibrio breoganii]
MDQGIVLNGRQYRLCDMGEGECTLIIINNGDLASLTKHYMDNGSRMSSQMSSEIDRLIVLDTSTAWPIPFSQFDQMKVTKLVEDIRLLLDIYWLDEVSIEIEGEMNCLSEEVAEMLFAREYC